MRAAISRWLQPCACREKMQLISSAVKIARGCAAPGAAPSAGVLRRAILFDALRTKNRSQASRDRIRGINLAPERADIGFRFLRTSQIMMDGVVTTDVVPGANGAITFDGQIAIVGHASIA